MKKIKITDLALKLDRRITIVDDRHIKAGVQIYLNYMVCIQL